MTSSKGYYSLIQYCPDLGRLEAANVGVLLFCPEQQFLKARTVRSNRRIMKFFGTTGHDWSRISSFKQGLEDRLSVEASEIRSIGDLERFIAMRANLLQITPPRPMKVTDPEKDLETLFTEITGEVALHGHGKSLRKQLEAKIDNAGLSNKVRRNIPPIEVPVYKKSLQVPLGFQNGRFNLINPVPFEAADPNQAFNTACKYAVEGKSIYDHPHTEFGQMQLFIVGKFRANDTDSPEIVRKVLVDHDVRLYRFSELPKLFDEIRRTAKDVENSNP